MFERNDIKYDYPQCVIDGKNSKNKNLAPYYMNHRYVWLSEYYLPKGFARRKQQATNGRM